MYKLQSKILNMGPYEMVKYKKISVDYVGTTLFFLFHLHLLDVLSQI